MAKLELTLEEQIAKLTGQVTDLTTKSEEYKRTIEQQKGKLDSQGKELAAATEARDQATSQAGRAVERVRELEKEAEANEQTILGYEKQLRAAEAGSDGSVVVTHEDKLYRVVVPHFQHEGKPVTAEALSADASLVAKLVTAGSGILQHVED